MSLPNTLAAYSDIAAVLASLGPDGGRMVCLPPNPSATYWRLRAHKYRALLQRDGISTPYDHLVFRIDPAEPNVVLIAPRSPVGHLESPTGQPIAPPPAKPDDLLEAARALARDLGLED